MHSTKMHKHRTTEEEEEEGLCPSLSTHQVNPGLNLRLVCAAPPGIWDFRAHIHQ
jgi:hypothetical protein